MSTAAIDHKSEWLADDKNRLNSEVEYLNERNKQARQQIGERDAEIKRLKAELNKRDRTAANQAAVLAEEVRQRHMGSELVKLDCESEDMPERFDVDAKKLVMLYAVYEWVEVGE